MIKANIAAESFALLVTLLLLLCNGLDDGRKDRPNQLMNAMLWVNAGLLACCIATWAVEGRARYEVLDRFLTFGACGLTFPLAGLYAEYTAEAVAEQTPISSRWVTTIRVVQGICGLGLFLNFVSVFNGMYFSCPGGVYTRGPLFLLNQAFSAVIILPVALLIVRNRGVLGARNTFSLLSYAALPLLIALTQFAVSGFTTMCLSTTLSMLIVYVTIYVERGRRLAEKEQQLTESRVAVMLSQMQPHFLYNALAAIQEICHDKSPEAEEATVEFAEFLRGNMDSLQSTRPVPFSQELNHTQNYLSLESKRFGSQLRVEYHITATEFSLPALTLQPVVENAVRYGVMKQMEGGTVKISTRETDTSYEIVVEDNGAGCDVAQASGEDSYSYVGLSNVRARLRTLCHGSLTIVSTPQVGTTAVISLPKAPA